MGDIIKQLAEANQEIIYLKKYNTWSQANNKYKYKIYQKIRDIILQLFILRDLPGYGNTFEDIKLNLDKLKILLDEEKNKQQPMFKD